MLNLGVMDVPSLDFGFSRATTAWAKDIQKFEANGVPMAAVTRDICKFLLHASKRRDQDLSAFMAEPGATMMSYKDTMTMQTSRSRLLLITRETRAEEQTIFQQQLQCAIAAGLFEHAPAKRQPRAASPRVTFSDREEEAGNGGSSAESNTSKNERKGKGSPGGHPSWSEIDQKMWREHYGDEKTGRKRRLCFFFSNRPGGCVKEGECEWDHVVPGRYSGKTFENLSQAKAEFVVQQCTRP
jgi:hypothetical protein